MHTNITKLNTNHVKTTINNLNTNPTHSLKELLPSSMIKNHIIDMDYRERFFTPSITIWSLITQVLSDDQSCQSTVAKTIAYLISQGKCPPSANTAAYCKARTRLPERVLTEISHDLAAELEEKSLSSWSWNKKTIKLIDGSTVSMPDTIANQAHYPQSTCQKAGVGFPIARIAATDLSKIRNRCILMTPKSFDEVAHYSKALFYALRENYPINVNIVKTLIQSGATINKKDVESWLITPKDLTLESIINTAIIINQVMRLIIYKDRWNENTLNEFVELMKNNAVRMNIEIDGAPSLLHRAVLADNYEIIPYLIQHATNLNVNIPGFKQKTPLHYAVKQDLRTLNCLLKQEKIELDAKDDFLQTPLHDALLTNNPDIVLALLEAGANINSEDMFKGTPLYYAVIGRRVEIIKCFMEHKSANLHKLNINGESILHIAATKGDVSILSILLKKFKDRLHEKDAFGNTLLHAAALEGKFDMIKYLITEHQFDVNARNFKAESALDYFIKHGKNPDDIKWLIEQAGVNEANNRVFLQRKN